MGTHHIKMEGSELEMKTVTDQELKQRRTKSVSVKLSAAALAKMKKVAGIKQGTENQILHAYITKTLQDAEV